MRWSWSRREHLAVAIAVLISTAHAKPYVSLSHLPSACSASLGYSHVEQHLRFTLTHVTA